MNTMFADRLNAAGFKKFICSARAAAVTHRSGTATTRANRWDEPDDSYMSQNYAFVKVFHKKCHLKKHMVK